MHDDNLSAIFVKKLQEQGLTQAEIEYFLKNDFAVKVAAKHLRELKIIIEASMKQLEISFGVGDESVITDVKQKVIIAPKQNDKDKEKPTEVIEPDEDINQADELEPVPEEQFLEITPRGQRISKLQLNNPFVLGKGIRVFGTLRRRFVLKAVKDFMLADREPTLEDLADHLAVDKQVLRDFGIKYLLIQQRNDKQIVFKARSTNRRIKFSYDMLMQLKAAVVHDIGYFDMDEACNRIGVDNSTMTAKIKKHGIELLD